MISNSDLGVAIWGLGCSVRGGEIPHTLDKRHDGIIGGTMSPNSVFGSIITNATVFLSSINGVLVVLL